MADERKSSKASSASLKMDQQSPEITSPLAQTTAPVTAPEVYTTPVSSVSEVSSTPVTSAPKVEPTPVTVAAVEPTPVAAATVEPTPVAALTPKTSISSHGSATRKASSTSNQDKPKTSILGQQVLTPALVTDGSLERKSSGLKDSQVEPSSAALLGGPHDPGHFDAEENVQKLKYPKSVFFIVTNEFCERFSFYGLRTLLVLYLSTVLKYSDDLSTVIYHVFVSFSYFFPVLGAIIADSFLGKFRTIVYLSCVYAIGNITLTLASADTAIPGMPARAISMIGLLLIALGTGGIKPCVSAFGGDQFIIPQQQKQLDRFFSIFYFSINSGSFISTFITPILREDVHCFDKESCYPLAFGVPAILMVTSLIVFVAGKSFYVMKKPTGNVIVEIFRVIGHALSVKRKSKEKKEHWLDHAVDKYGKKSIHDIKLLLRVLFLYIPLPIFWALFDQQGSRWTFQATRMNGKLGDFTIKPEQMQVVNPLLILAFVPLFEVAVYPLLAKCNILTKPLQRLGTGGVLAGVAFLVSAFIEISLEPGYAVLPKPGNGQLRFYNGFDCPLTINSDLANNEDSTYVMEALDLWEIKNWEFEGDEKPYSFKITMGASCPDPGLELQSTATFKSGKAVTYFITYATGTTGIAMKDNLVFDDVEKTSTANPKLRLIYDFLDDSTKTVQLVAKKDDFTSEFILNDTTVGTDYQELTISLYDVLLDDTRIIEDLLLDIGAVYSLVIEENVEGGTYRSKLHTITPPNSVHILWLLPQYIIMTAAEVMYSVTGVAFSFTQAPISMKSVLQAAWLVTVGIGNLVVVIIAESKIFDSQVYEFLLFAVLMFLDMMLFAAMAWNYKYVNLKEEEEIAMLDSQKTGVDNKTYTSDQE